MSDSDDSDTSSDANEFVAAGRMDLEVYERLLQPWRATLRRPIVKMVEKESHIIAAMQVLSISHFNDPQPGKLMKSTLLVVV